MKTLAALLLAGCTHIPSPAYFPSPSDVTRLEAVRTAWDRAGLPSSHTPHCDDAVRHWRVAQVPDDELGKWCAPMCSPGQCPGFRASDVCRFGCAARCYQEISKWRVAVLGTSVPIEQTGHEALHMLESCTGKSPGGDMTHSDPRIWGKSGLIHEAEP